MLTYIIIAGVILWGAIALRAIKKGNTGGCSGNCSSCSGCK